ncbi:hypothetical protein [Aeromicrobium sp. UC242_57]|uniref:hypothetical protein n=1 Tax=Aeromicrobium sp. UC242_57 TaxID=3374624 RepID=UPI0037AF400E
MRSARRAHPGRENITKIQIVDLPVAPFTHRHSREAGSAIAPLTPAIDARWPPAFSPEFISAARAMLERHSALLVVGSPGSHRHRLGAEIVTSPDYDGVVLHHVCAIGDADRPHQLLSRVLVDLGGRDDLPADEVLDEIRRLIRTRHATPPTLILDDASFASPESLTRCRHSQRAGTCGSSRP